MADLSKELKKLEKKIKILEEEIEQLKIGYKAGKLTGGMPFVQFYEGYLTMLWNELIDIGYKIKSSMFVDEDTANYFYSLFQRIELIYDFLKDTYLEKRAKKIYNKALEIKKILDKKPRKPTVKFILPK